MCRKEKKHTLNVIPRVPDSCNKSKICLWSVMFILIPLIFPTKRWAQPSNKEFNLLVKSSFSCRLASSSDWVSDITPSGCLSGITSRKHFAIAVLAFFRRLGTSILSMIPCWRSSLIRFWKNRLSIFVGFENPYVSLSSIMEKYNDYARW